MVIYIKKTRKDNKVIVSYRFDNGRIINELTPLSKIATLMQRYPDATYSGNTDLLSTTPLMDFSEK